MRIPKSGCHWTDRAANELGSCNFEMFLGKMEDIQEEFDGSPRKQTKVDTLVEGFKKSFNQQAATGLVGQKFLISKSGKPLNVTALPADILKAFPLPTDYENELKGTSNNPAPTGSGAFGGFGKPKANSIPSANDGDSRRISLAAKCMFMQLGAALEVVYGHDDDDLVIVEVGKVQKPDSLIEAVFDSGDIPNGAEAFNISFGLLKEIK